MRNCQHTQRAPSLRRPLYFVGRAPGRGTFCSGQPFFIESPIGGDDEKPRSYSTGRRRYYGVGDVFVCPEQSTAGQYDGTTHSGSAIQRLRHSSGRQGLDGLDWRCPRPDPSNDRSRHQSARYRSGKGSACDGDRRRFKRATEAISAQSNAGVTFWEKSSRACREIFRPDRCCLNSGPPTVLTAIPHDPCNTSTIPRRPRDAIERAHVDVAIRRNATPTSHELNT